MLESDDVVLNSSIEQGCVTSATGGIQSIKMLQREDYESMAIRSSPLSRVVRDTAASRSAMTFSRMIRMLSSGRRCGSYADSVSMLTE